MFAGLPVDVIVAAEGDLNRTFELLTCTLPPVRPDNGKPDPRAVRNRLRKAITTGQSQGQQAPAPDDFNG